MFAEVLQQHFLIKQIKYISIVNLVNLIFTAIFLLIGARNSSTVKACLGADKSFPLRCTFTSTWIFSRCLTITLDHF